MPESTNNPKQYQPGDVLEEGCFGTHIEFVMYLPQLRSYIFRVIETNGYHLYNESDMADGLQLSYI